MPTVSIDTFFACSLIVAVALLATASVAGTMQTRITSLQDLNKDDYLKAIADQLVTRAGTPEDWGANGSVIPESFGLDNSASPYLYELDIDKITRLSNQSNYALSYFQTSQAAKLENLAFGISISQMLTITTELSGNTTDGGETTYSFTISVSQAQGSINANLHCYAVAEDFLADAYDTTSDAGIGTVSFQIPNTSDGPALLVVFARASFDDRLTAYACYSFAHLSQEPLPNHTFTGLSPLNYTLNLNPNTANITVDEAYAFSYAYQSNLTSTSSTTYAIPTFLDKSPTVLVVSGHNDTASFIEWTAYPDVPLEFGANFANSEKNAFIYTVSIKEILYKLTLSLGDVAR
jgi:hypothetical protein